MVLSLSRKALILVAVPLVFELGFLVTLGLALEQVEQEKAREAHARDIGAHLNNILRMVLDRQTSLVLKYLSNNKKIFSDRFHSASGKIDQEFQILTVICKNNEHETKKLLEFDSIRNLIDRHFEQARILMEQDERQMAMKEWVILQKYIDQVHVTLEEFVEEQQNVQIQRKANLANYREWVKSLIAFGFAFNIVLAVGLAWFFNKGTISRLNIVMDNTHRLAAKQTLNEPLTGSDEIAHVDQTFHDMASKLEVAEEARVKVEKLKQEFVQMVSHDLRSPLASLKMFHSLLAEGTYGQLSEEGQKRLYSANINLDNLVNMVNELVYIEKLESGTVELEKQKLKVDLFIEPAVSALSGMATSRNVAVEIMAHDNPSVLGDRERLVQVLQNLIANAIKYSPEKGMVLIGTKTESDWVEISVTDQGKGIPEELQGAIFERFRQVEPDKKNAESSGLGLAIAKSLIELHGGVIGVDSKKSEGSRFWFRLPRST